MTTAVVIAAPHPGRYLACLLGGAYRGPPPPPPGTAPGEVCPRRAKPIYMKGHPPMAVRFKDSDPRPRDPADKVAVTCDRCPWSKAVVTAKVVSALRGHYGYAHAGAPLPTHRECLARTTPSA